MTKKLPRPPCKGEPRELMRNPSDEREARDDKQWRRSPSGIDDWMGVWGKQSFPRLEEPGLQGPVTIASPSART